MKIINAGVAVIIAILLSACSQQNLSKQQILRVAHKVDEIRIRSISYPQNDGGPTYRVVHRYEKRSADFAVLLNALRNSANTREYATAIPNRRITLLGNGKELMELRGHSGAGQFARSKLKGMESRRNHIFLSSEGKRLVE